MGTFLKTDEGACCKQIGEPFYKEDKIAIAVRTGEQALIDKFNAAIDAIRANGEYQKISEKYFGTDIY
jgi:ABC-type amino acid transport substrate-binding protein